MSYIEKEKAIENVSQIRLEVVGARAVGKTIFTEALHIYRDAVLKSLNEAPTADVVEVVRCKDCKKWEKYENTSGAGYCHNKKYCFTYGTMLDREFTPITMPDDYCSYGERREENERT